MPHMAVALKNLLSIAGGCQALPVHHLTVQLNFTGDIGMTCALKPSRMLHNLTGRATLLGEQAAQAKRTGACAQLPCWSGPASK